MRRKKRRRWDFIAVFLIAIIALGIFAYIKFWNGKFVYISTGFKENELFKIDTMKADIMEANLLLSDAKKEYEKLFGNGIWNQNIEDVTFNDYIKEQVKAKLIRVYCMNLMADETGVALSRNVKDGIEAATDEYFSSLSLGVIDKYGITKEKVKNMFIYFAKAAALYNDCTEDFKAEISLDDARVITIQYICADTKEQIDAAKTRLDNNEIFYVVAKDINQGEYERECRRGELDEAFEKAAYNLKSGEVSDIVEAGGKYYIIKCNSDNEKSKTEANKIAILEKKKLESFNAMFEPYEAQKYIYFNQELWEQCNVSGMVTIDKSFEDVFNSHVK